MTDDGSAPTADGEQPESADQAHWSSESLAYDLLHERAAVIAELVVDARPTSVLELGCSTGRLCSEIIGRLPAVSYSGTDISAEALTSVRGATVVQADLNRQGVPFLGQRFDCIVGSGILEYIDDLDDLMRALRARLDSGGSLVASYVNRRHFKRMIKRVAGRHAGDPTWRPLRPIPGLLRSASAAGFDDAVIYPVDGSVTSACPGAVARTMERGRDDIRWIDALTWRQAVIRWTAR